MAPFQHSADISRRHPPSDASFSFQFPGPLNNYNLLTDDNADFFQGADDTIAPTSPTTAHRLCQLTPGPEPSRPPHLHEITRLSDEVPLNRLYDQPAKNNTTAQSPKKIRKASSPSKPKHTEMQILRESSVEGSPAAQRLFNLRAQVDSLTADTHTRPSNVQGPSCLNSNVQNDKGWAGKSQERENARDRQKRDVPKPKGQAVVFGGIRKVRGVDFRASPKAIEFFSESSTRPQGHLNESTPKAMDPLQTDGLSYGLLCPDDSMVSNLSMTGGVAGRLVMYGKTLISSCGVDPAVTLEAQNGPAAISSEGIALHTSANDKSSPLTLSQLSPRKVESHPGMQSSSVVPMSPTRPSSKRPVPVSDSNRIHKKPKAAPSATVSVVDSTGPAHKPPTKKQSRLLTSGSSSVSSRDKVKQTKMKSSIKQERPRSFHKPRKAPPKNVNELDMASQAPPLEHTGALTSRKPWLQNDESTEAKNVISKPSINVAESSASSKHAIYHLAIPTKPVEFKFQSDARMRSRKGENEGYLSKNQQHASSGVPDFKTLHAAHEAQSAHRKENIVPVIPLPIRFKTDERVKERQKFDERMKEKEREMERAMEQRRREREEEEEREVKELRKRAIPKAHEVPEWYKEAPKKKDKGMGSVGS